MPASAIFMPQRARRNNMDYFYEHESELFTFYRVPKGAVYGGTIQKYEL